MVLMITSNLSSLFLLFRISLAYGRPFKENLHTDEILIIGLKFDEENEVYF